jgi:hypothetical protein
MGTDIPNMSRGRGARNYAVGMATSFTSLRNMYIYGGSILASITILFGMWSTGEFNQAMELLFEQYVFRLLPWSLDELLMSEDLFEFLSSHVVTIIVGLCVATFKYRANPGY